MTPRIYIRKLAQRFLVRRYGKKVDWNCTYLEIAQATGLAEWTVRKVCRDAGYPVEGDDHRREGSKIIAVDSFIAMRSHRHSKTY